MTTPYQILQSSETVAPDLIVWLSNEQDAKNSKHRLNITATTRIIRANYHLDIYDDCTAPPQCKSCKEESREDWKEKRCEKIQ